MMLAGLIVSALGGLLMTVPYWLYGPARDRLLILTAGETPGLTKADDVSERLQKLNQKGVSALNRSVIANIELERRLFGLGLLSFVIGQCLQVAALVLAPAGAA